MHFCHVQAFESDNDWSRPRDAWIFNSFFFCIFNIRWRDRITQTRMLPLTMAFNAHQQPSLRRRSWRKHSWRVDSSVRTIHSQARRRMFSESAPARLFSARSSRVWAFQNRCDECTWSRYSTNRFGHMSDSALIKKYSSHDLAHFGKRSSLLVWFPHTRIEQWLLVFFIDAIMFKLCRFRFVLEIEAKRSHLRSH